MKQTKKRKPNTVETNTMTIAKFKIAICKEEKRFFACIKHKGLEARVAYPECDMNETKSRRHAIDLLTKSIAAIIRNKSFPDDGLICKTKTNLKGFLSKNLGFQKKIRKVLGKVIQCPKI
jgi:hypothetical protein